MNEHERRRRTVAAQGFAAIALLIFAHGAHAATGAAATPPRPPVAIQVRAT
jgi:hypothetical protein